MKLEISEKNTFLKQIFVFIIFDALSIQLVLLILYFQILHSYTFGLYFQSKNNNRDRESI